MGPYDQTMPWSNQGIEGSWRFLNRIWRLLTEADFQGKPSLELKKLLNKVNKKVTEDIESLNYNTAIAKIMELVNFFYTHKKEIDKETVKTLTLLLAPFVPYFAQEVWSEVLKEKGFVHQQSWPKFDKNLIKEEKVIIIIQINGKLRGEIEVSDGTGQSEVEKLAKKEINVAKFLEGKKIKKVVFVPDRIINFVTS